MTQVLLRELPNLLSELRDEDIALGALRSLPLSPAQVWRAAIEDAMETADREILGSSVRSLSRARVRARSLSLSLYSPALSLSLSLSLSLHSPALSLSRARSLSHRLRTPPGHLGRGIACDVSLRSAQVTGSTETRLSDASIRNLI
jgi:hypothetical protein